MGLLKKARTALAAALPDKKYLGVHVRRGDRSVQSWKYHDKYVPLSAFIDAAGATWKKLVDNGPSPPPVWLASDSPAAIDEWTKTAPAKVFSLRASGDTDLKNIASPWEYVQAEFDELPEEERVEQTRGMVVDFGLMSGMWAEDGDVVPEAVVCGMRYVAGPNSASHKFILTTTARSSVTWLRSPWAGNEHLGSRTAIDQTEAGMRIRSAGWRSRMAAWYRRCGWHYACSEEQMISGVHHTLCIYSVRIR
jgi:hypothetical protein